jgi:prepilin peptidase CpaA
MLFPQGDCMPPVSILWAYVLLAVALPWAAVVDLRKGLAPNYITLPAALAGLVGHALVGGMWGSEHALGLSGSLAGLAVGFAPMFVAWRMGGVGGGDVKLMAAVGALTGWRFALSALFFGLIAAAIMAIIVMARAGVIRKTLGRVWHCLMLALAFRKTIDPAVADSPKAPLAVAFCIGSAAAIVEAIWRGSGSLLGL